MSVHLGPEYASSVSESDVALQWARKVSEYPAVVERVVRYVAIHRQRDRRKQYGDLLDNQCDRV